MLYRVTAKVQGKMQIEGMRTRALGNATMLESCPLNIQADDLLDTTLDVQPWVDAGYLMPMPHSLVVADVVATADRWTVRAPSPALVIEMTTVPATQQASVPIFIPQFTQQDPEPSIIEADLPPMASLPPVGEEIVPTAEEQPVEKRRQGRRARRKDIPNG